MTETKLSAIELEMQKAQDAYTKRMERLKKRAADEEKRVTAKLVEVLQTEHEDIYEQVRAQAVAQLETERAERSKAAKEARGTDVADAVEVGDPQDDEGGDTSKSETFALQRSA